MDQPKRRGRPTKEEGEKLVRGTLYLLPRQWAKIEAAGGVEKLRKLIDRWRPK